MPVTEKAVLMMTMCSLCKKEMYLLVILKIVQIFYRKNGSCAVLLLFRCP